MAEFLTPQTNLITALEAECDRLRRENEAMRAVVEAASGVVEAASSVVEVDDDLKTYLGKDNWLIIGYLLGASERAIDDIRECLAEYRREIHEISSRYPDLTGEGVVSKGTSGSTTQESGS